MNSLYRVHIHDREYNSWAFLYTNTSTPKPLTESESLINPATLKLFSNDLIDLSTPIPTVINSPTRNNLIPGVLMLAENKTYGRTANKKRLLYKCIPNDRFLPAFLVPYSPDIGFSKITQNRFVVFKFDNWAGAHPHGILVENLGEVGNLTAFYEYQLYCRSLYDSISGFNKVAKQAAISSATAIGEAGPRFPSIFSIDPPGASDQDDALSIELANPTKAIVRVYIANVFTCLETLALWKSFSNRVSTIYLPDFKRPMLPTVLSDNICSLTEGQPRQALCMEVEIDLTTNTIVVEKTKFYNQTIRVSKNYAYESPHLLANPDYQLILKCTKALDPAIVDSADMVAFWMIQMNVICGELLQSRGVGIFRQASWHPFTEEPRTMSATIVALPNTLTSSTKRLIANWRHTTGQYAVFNKDHPIEHVTMGKESYVHITSPIRRIVDLLNQIVFQVEFNLVDTISPEAKDFVEHWTQNIDYINTTMRSIKKIQLDCDMIHRCTEHPEWTEREHRGALFDRIQRTDSMYSYMVYLQDLNILGRITTQEKYENYSVVNVRIFVFQDEERLHRKVRLGIVD